MCRHETTYIAVADPVIIRLPNIWLVENTDNILKRANMYVIWEGNRRMQFTFKDFKDMLFGSPYLLYKIVCRVLCCTLTGRNQLMVNKEKCLQPINKEANTGMNFALAVLSLEADFSAFFTPEENELNMSSAEILLLSAIEDNDELVLISTEMNQSHGNVYNREKNNLEVLTNEQCRFMFRFEKQDIDRVCVALGIPPKIVCNNGTVASGIEGLCIVLKRLSYHNRLEDISPIFQRPLYELSYIISKTLDIIYDNTSQKLTSLDQEWLSEEYICRGHS
ncbi:unnamed protein product [Mytilus coruscus]|uniref:Uncharacterized protein n=1 Tax=Mytilus coruscus TaxID=42192 RepID=A0A6J8ETK3_MYTCO|nr:unnamed protein product [Mytilus coruscus]